MLKWPKIKVLAVSIACNHNKLTEEDQLFVLLPKIKGYLITFQSIANENQYKDKP